MSYLFLFKNYSNDDRDCVGYVEDKHNRFECGHYFGSVVITGACCWRHDFPQYKDIKTILTKEEFEELIDLSNQLYDLRFGIRIGDERYKKGIKISSKIDQILDKLRSEENQKLFQEVQKEEIEYLVDKYSLTKDEVQDIFDNYNLDYRDRGVVGYIFEDAYELGYEEFFSLGYIDNHNENLFNRYFNYEAFGKDLASEENYHQLDDGRIACLNY